MTRLSKILVPVEFSPQCLGSAQYAEALACHFHCDLTLLHILRPPYMAYSVPDVAAYASVVDIESDLLREAQARLDAFPVALPAGIRIDRQVLLGHRSSTIVDFARDGRFDLIVMPTHGYGPLRRMLQGSITARVLRDAPCPVWSGPHIDSVPADFHTVLCALDLRPESRTVLDFGAALARDYGAQLHVVHVLPNSSIRVGNMYFDPDWHAGMVAHAKEEIGKLQSELHTDARPWIETGDTTETIKGTAERLGAELLVIGRGHHAGLGDRKSVV